MATQRFDLQVEPREIGKHFSRKLRREKKIPAVVYGSVSNKNIFLEENVVLKFNTRAHENALFNVKSSDKDLNNVVVMMKDVVVHPVSRRPEHVDLFALDLKKAVRISVEIRFDGKPIGLAEGGLLNIVNRQVEIECLPTQIPENFSIDISALSVGDALHVSDLKLPPEIKLISAPELTLAVVNLIEEEAAATPAVEAAAATPAAAGAPAAPGAAPAAAGAKADPKAAAAKPAAGAKPAAAAKDKK